MQLDRLFSKSWYRSPTLMEDLIWILNCAVILSKNPEAIVE